MKIPKISTHLWFDKEAREAAEFYCSVIPGSKITNITVIRDTPSGACDLVNFELAGAPFTAISAGPLFAFNESFSLMIHCDTQEEIDEYWKKLSAVPEAEQCGWLKDKFGLSWQIVPTDMDAMLTKGSPEQVARVTQAFLQMKKFNLAKLRKAYEGS